MELSRTNPSEEYTWCLSNYTELHQGGKLFDGRSLKKFIRLLNGLIKTNRSETLLDYGSGQGMLYGPHFAVLTGLIDKPLADYWGVDVDLYEPGLPEHESLPDKLYDAVICTDVLEHIPESDLGWVIDEILERSSKFAFLNIATFPALKTFKDGTNVHVSVFSPNIWLDLLAQKDSKTPIYVYFDVIDDNRVAHEGFKVEGKRTMRLGPLSQEQIQYG